MLPDLPVFVSGDTPQALADACLSTAALLAAADEPASHQVLADLCARTALAAHGQHRAVVVADSPASAARRLEAVGRAGPGGTLTLRADRAAAGSPAGGEKVALLYPGQGGQSLGETAEVAAASGRYAARVRQLEGWYDDAVLTEALSSAWPDRSGPTDVTGTAVAQPMLATVAVAMTDLLVASGVRPTVVAGHSVGELGALYAAGALGAAEVLTVIHERVRAMSGQATGTAMMAVAGDPATLRDVVAAADVHLACDNSPGQVVLGGQRETLERLVDDLSAYGLRCQMLPNEGAFHTPWFAEPEARLGHQVRQRGVVAAERLTATLVSSVSGRQVETGAAGLDLALHQISHPVRFREAVQHVAGAEPDVVVQVSGGTFMLSWLRGVDGLDRAVTVGLGGPRATASDLAVSVGQLFLSLRAFRPAVVYGGAGIASRAVRVPAAVSSVVDTSALRALAARPHSSDPPDSSDLPGLTAPARSGGTSHLASGVLEVIGAQHDVIAALLGPRPPAAVP